MEKPFWHSKKFWASAVATAVPILNYVYDLGLTQDAVMQIVTPILAYILGQGLADLGKNSNK
jgi:hypothetical protein